MTDPDPVAPSPVSRGWRAVAWAVAGASWSLGAAALLIGLVTGRLPDLVADWIMDLVVSAIYPVVILVMLPRTRALVVWVLVALALGCGLAGFCEQYALLGSGLPLHGLALAAPLWVWVPGTYGILSVLPWLVLDRVDGGRTTPRTVVAVSAAGIAILLATLRGATVVLAGEGRNPLAVAAWADARRALALWPDWGVTVIGAAALVAIAFRRRARRRQGAPTAGLGWLLTAQAIMLLAFLLLLWPAAPEQAPIAAEVSGTALLLAQAFLSGAVLVLVLGNRMWGIDVTVSRALSWTTMTVLVVAAYVSVTAALGLLIPVPSELLLALVVAVFALAITPARRWVQRRVDVLIYGELARPSSRGSGRALWSTLGEPGAGLDEIAASLREGLRVERLEVVETGADPALLDAGTTLIPLRSRDRDVGALAVAARYGERLDARTMIALRQVARLLALVVDLRQSNEALEQTRTRLVRIRQDERRVLRRDLHDGLGPALAGLRLALGAALNLLESDRERARTVIEQVHEELARRGDDIRLLSRALLPPALDDGDLTAALTGLAQRFSSGALRVTAHAEEGVEVPGRAQLALYHIASEALMNVHRHARAASCEILLRAAPDGAVELHVRDDGIGLDTARPRSPGVGLTSMRERVEELGGSFALESLEAGTRVRVRLPAVATAL